MKKQPIVSRLINAVMNVVEAIIGVHIILKLFSANSDTPFVQWIFSISEPLLRPFRGIFDDVIFQDQYVLDLSAVFALIIYSIIGYLIMTIVKAIGGGRRRKK
jgi:uncharacterized protein YggT (Ycf19 family)